MPLELLLDLMAVAEMTMMMLTTVNPTQWCCRQHTLPLELTAWTPTSSRRAAYRDGTFPSTFCTKSWKLVMVVRVDQRGP